MRPWLTLTLLLVVGPAGAGTVQEVVTDVWVHDVPGAPGGGFWDPAAEHLLSTFTNPASVYPDVMVCARPARVATPHCTKICWDLKGDSHGDGKNPSTECQQPLHVPLVPDDPRVVLEVLEMDHDGDGVRVHAIIARNVVVSDPSHCTEDRPCRWTSPQGALVLSFSTQVRGVLGTPGPSSPAPPPTQGGGSSLTSSPLWQHAVNGARKAGKAAGDAAENAARQYAQGKDPTAPARDVTQHSLAATQAAINSCVSAIAAGNATFSARMPLCVNQSGKDFEVCVTQKVLGDDPSAVYQAANCSRQFQDEGNQLGKSAVYVWLKGQVCGIGQWIGLGVCRQ